MLRLLLVLFALCAAPAYAQSPAPSALLLAEQASVSADAVSANSAAVDACLDKAQDEAALFACKSVMAEPCMDEDAAATTYGRWICARALRAAWAPALAHVRAQVREEATAYNAAQAFDDGERAWEQWRSAWCGLMWRRFEGGSGAKVALSQCFADTDIDHVVTLKYAMLGY